MVSALGLTVLQVALQAGDALARQLLGDAANKFALFMRRRPAHTRASSVFVTLLVSCVAAVLSLVQWMLMALRQAGLLVLAAMLPLAAAGRADGRWLHRLLSWLVAMVAYKPAAAFIYYLGFTYLSSTSGTPPGRVGDQVTGMMVLLLAVLAMPVLLRFFSWSGTAVGRRRGRFGVRRAPPGRSPCPGRYGRRRSQQAAAIDATGPGSVTTASSYPAARRRRRRSRPGAADRRLASAACTAAAARRRPGRPVTRDDRRRPGDGTRNRWAAVSAGTPTRSGPRLYGNWRAERGWGVGSLSTTATVTVFARRARPRCWRSRSRRRPRCRWPGSGSP